MDKTYNGHPIITTGMILNGIKIVASIKCDYCRKALKQKSFWASFTPLNEILDLLREAGADGWEYVGDENESHYLCPKCVKEMNDILKGAGKE